MTFIIKRVLFYSAFLVIAALFIPAVTAAEVISSEEIEESADMVMHSDYIITGKMNKYSKTAIEVEGISYTLCNNVIIFTPGNRKINIKKLHRAEEVKLFENRNCIRKIKVLRFAKLEV